MAATILEANASVHQNAETSYTVEEESASYKRRRRFSRRSQKISSLSSSIKADRMLLNAAIRYLHRSDGHPFISYDLVSRSLGARLTFNIDPMLLQRQVGKYVRCRSKWRVTNTHFAFPGDWDVNPLLVRDHPTIKHMTEIGSTLDDYRRGDIYQSAVSTVSFTEGLNLGGRLVRSKSDIDDYFLTYNALMKDMIENGYRTTDKSHKGYIGVAVGRNGELLHNRIGHHRLGAAQFLNVKKIPVKILMVHSEWLLRVIRGATLPAAGLSEAIEALGSDLEHR